LNGAMMSLDGLHVVKLEIKLRKMFYNAIKSGSLNNILMDNNRCIIQRVNDDDRRNFAFFKSCLSEQFMKSLFKKNLGKMWVAW